MGKKCPARARRTNTPPYHQLRNPTFHLNWKGRRVGSGEGRGDGPRGGGGLLLTCRGVICQKHTSVPQPSALSEPAGPVALPFLGRPFRGVQNGRSLKCEPLVCGKARDEGLDHEAEWAVQAPCDWV